MPSSGGLFWTIIPERRLIVISALGRVRAPDFERYIDDIKRRKVLGYRKLLDLSLKPGSIVPTDLPRFVEIARAVAAEDGGLGPLAFIVADGAAGFVADYFTIQTADLSRQVAVFASSLQATAWLDEVLPVDRA